MKKIQSVFLILNRLQWLQKEEYFLGQNQKSVKQNTNFYLDQSLCGFYAVIQFIKKFVRSNIVPTKDTTEGNFKITETSDNNLNQKMQNILNLIFSFQFLLNFQKTLLNELLSQLLIFQNQYFIIILKLKSAVQLFAQMILNRLLECQYSYTL